MHAHCNRNEMHAHCNRNEMHAHCNRNEMHAHCNRNEMHAHIAIALHRPHDLVRTHALMLIYSTWVKHYPVTLIAIEFKNTQKYSVPYIDVCILIRI